MIEVRSGQLNLVHGSRQDFLLRIENRGRSEAFHVTVRYDFPPSLGCTDVATLRIPRLAAGGVFLQSLKAKPSSVGNLDVVCEIKYVDKEQNHYEHHSACKIVVAKPGLATQSDTKLTASAGRPCLMLGNLVPNQARHDWQVFSVAVNNTGGEEARKVTVTLHGPFEGDRECAVDSVSPGIEQVFSFNLKPKGAGELRATLDCRYIDASGALKALSAKAFTVSVKQQEELAQGGVSRQPGSSTESGQGIYMKSLFLSHIEEDREIALRLGRELEAAGYPVWAYENDALPAVSYLDNTRKAIDGCDAFLLLISPRSMASHEVDTEIQYAHQVARPVVPVLLDVSDIAYKRKKPQWHQIVGTATSIEITAETVRSVAHRIAAGMAELGIRCAVHSPSTELMADEQRQPGPGRMTEADVHKLAAEARTAPQARAKEIVAQLMEIAERADQDDIAQEAVFRLGCIAFREALPCLFRIADDKTRSSSLRQRAMIDLCSILGHDHPHATFAGMGEWLKWWNRDREHLMKQIDEQAEHTVDG